MSATRHGCAGAGKPVLAPAPRGVLRESAQTGFKWKQAEDLIACLGDEYLLLHFDALRATHFTDVALDTDRHAGRKDAVHLSRLLGIAADAGPLVDHANAMRDTAVILVVKPRRDRPRPFDELPKTEAWLEQRTVEFHLLNGQRIQASLLTSRRCIATVESTADVAAVAERTDHVRIETHQITVVDNSRRGFLEPRIGAGT